MDARQGQGGVGLDAFRGRLGRQDAMADLDEVSLAPVGEHEQDTQFAVAGLGRVVQVAVVVERADFIASTWGLPADKWVRVFKPVKS